MGFENRNRAVKTRMARSGGLARRRAGKGATMTAKQAGLLAAEGFWLTLKRLRDQWVLLAFLATALFWGRDIYEQFIDLPEKVQDLRGSIVELRRDLARLDQRAVDDRSPALVFPGTGHSVGDGRRGAYVTVTFSPAERVRDDCLTTALSVYMLDRTGRWFSVETDLATLPHFAGTQDLSFAARVHPRMTPGRAQFVAQIGQDCGTHQQVDNSPLLQFRVLQDQDG